MKEQAEKKFLSKEELQTMSDKLDKIAGEREEITKEVWAQGDLAMMFARPAMRGAIAAMLKLDEEAKNMVLKEIALASAESFLKTSEQTWRTDGSQQVAKAVMQGAFKGMRKLSDKDKALVFGEMGHACFHYHMSFVSPWEKEGIYFTPGSYDVDGAIVLLGHMLKLRELSRDENNIYWKGHVGVRYGRCSCAIIWSGITDETCLPDVCKYCATEVMKYQFEYLTGIPMKAELTDSMNVTGCQDCCWTVRINPPEPMPQ